MAQGVCPVIIAEQFNESLNWDPRHIPQYMLVFKQSALNLGARWGWVVNATPQPLYFLERPGINCAVGWVGPRADLDGCGKTRPHRDSIS
jgi:hypothetical protein